MKIIKRIKNKIVYALTDKPECYVHVDKPKSLQDLRQIQYNNWCKAKGIYNGSYLPEDPNTLTKKGKGWVETTSPRNMTGDKREYTRKSSGQIVRHDNETTKHGKFEEHHYHWYNGNSQSEKRANGKTLPYKDRYGNPCTKDDDGHHIMPLDREYTGGKKQCKKQ